MLQGKLNCALNQFFKLCQIIEQSGKSEMLWGNIKIELEDEWQSYDVCPHTVCNCKAVPARSWKASNGSKTVSVWEIRMHDAVAGHSISLIDIPESDRQTLIEFFGS